MKRVRLSLFENLRLAFDAGSRMPGREEPGIGEVVTALWFWVRGIPERELPVALATLEQGREERRARADRPMKDDTISRWVRRRSPHAPWPDKPTPRLKLEAEAAAAAEATGADTAAS